MKIAVNNDKPVGTSERFMALEYLLQRAKLCRKNSLEAERKAKKSECQEELIYRWTDHAAHWGAEKAYLDCIQMLGGRDVDSQT